MSNEVLREPWETMRRERAAASFGIWVFLASETLFFGALLMAFSVCRHYAPTAFAAAARETNVVFGTINTVILLTSSLTMAVAAEAAPLGAARAVRQCLLASFCLGLGFLVVKGFEYAEDFSKHLFPGPEFPLPELPSHTFFAFYWLLTVVHAVHLTIGLGVIAWLWRRARDPRQLASPAFEVGALYWHLVDVIWIFLYALIYLPGRAG